MSVIRDFQVRPYLSPMAQSGGTNENETQPTQSGTFFASPEFRRRGVDRRGRSHPASYNPACRGLTRVAAAKGELFHDYRRHSPTLLDYL
jgi:hypothetical protein